MLHTLLHQILTCLSIYMDVVRNSTPKVETPRRSVDLPIFVMVYIRRMDPEFLVELFR